MGFQQRMPSTPLDALIEKIGDWDMPQQCHHCERVLPLPGAALIINLHQDENRTYADDATPLHAISGGGGARQTKSAQPDH